MTYLLRRLVMTLPVLFGVITMTFLLIHFVPGDPVDIMLGDQASAMDKQALRQELGLDQPLAAQYGNFWSGLLRLDLGRSMQSKRPVLEEVAERLPATVELTFAAMLLASLIGLPLGVIAAVRRRGWVDRLILFWGWLAMSTPGFFLGPMLILVFAIELDLFPVSERGGLEHLILPAVTLAWSLSSVLMQTTRASMIEVAKEDYLNTARAKGASPFRVWFKHALGNALMPIITVLGLQFGALLTGTVIIETIYDWPGLGTLLFQGIQQRNYPLVQGCVLFTACIYVLVNVATDLAYAAANPKVRLS
ncbi:MAG: ABC transporter permease [Bdellovibrionaceae bacterium]|nr:ABC transporter permease [Pseudobdellovibrionaceae bacterium]